MKRLRVPKAMQRAQALLLSAAVLWTVSATAGSDSVSAATRSLRQALPLEVLRWELGDLWPQDTLSAATALTIGESPLLGAARLSVAELWNVEETAPEFVPLAPEEREETSVPVEETPLDTPVTMDNGVPAKTLVPTDPAGYTVFGRTYISNSSPHTLTEEALRRPFAARLAEDVDAPQILIIHTHGSEAYRPMEGTELVWSGDRRTTDSRYNVVKAGDEMAAVFAAAGIPVLHDRTLYDYPNYSGAYDRSLSAIKSYLAQYPSIRFILDVHRDAVEDTAGNEYKVVSAIDDRTTAAQLTLVLGSDGSGLAHPDWQENLRLAVAIQEALLKDYPTLMRPLLLRSSRYNQHATTGSLLVEVGAAGNSPEEAAVAARLFAQGMVQVLTAK
ncbi:MAG: stage II sporulation protein P [Ruminococcaceae bacterium]|nr:stage II sporulation protein P [Oscillospiraceae bacterium]